MRIKPRHLAILLPLVAACSTTSPIEVTGKAASAISPEQSINSASYILTLSSIGIMDNLNDIEGGRYVYYAAVGASVQAAGAGNGVLQNVIQGCSLGTAPVGVQGWDGPPQSYLRTCVSPVNTGAPAGNTLSQTVTVHDESDVVNFAVMLDNIETTPVAVVSDNLGSSLELEGNTLKTAGTVTTAIGAVAGGELAAAGAAISKVGSVISYIGQLLPQPSPETACTGGLVSVANPAFNGTKPNPPSDTLYLSYTAAQLEALTNTSGTGSATLSTNVGVTWPSPLPGDQWSECDSSTQINVTVTRVEGKGPAAYPTPGSIGVARYATEVDSIVPATGHQEMVDNQWTPSGWWVAPVTAPVYETGGNAPTATLSRQIPPLQEGPYGGNDLVPGPFKLIPATATTPATTNLEGTIDSFWFDTSGNLQWTNFEQERGWLTGLFAANAGAPGNRLTATSRTPSDTDVFWVNTAGNLMDATTTATPPVVVAAGVAMPGAGVAAVSRTRSTTDVLYIGSKGALFDAVFTLGSGWAAPFRISADGLAPAGAYITASARDANSIDAFFVGMNGDVYDASYAAVATNGQPFGWSAPMPIPGATSQAGAPISAVSRTQATIDLVYESNGEIEFTQHNPLSTASWSTPVAIGGVQLASLGFDLSLVARDSSHLTLFYDDFGYNPASLSWSQTPGTWTSNQPVLPSWQWNGWDTLSGGLVTSPTLAAPTPLELITAATAPNGAIWYAISSPTSSASSNQAWHTLGNNGNNLTDAPALVAINGKLEIFVRDPVTQHIIHKEGLCESHTSCYAPAWNGWEDLYNPNAPTTFVAGQPSVVVSQPNNEINVFATGTDGSVHTIQGPGYGLMGYVSHPGVTPGSWTWTTGNWTSLSGGVFFEPGAVSWGANRLDVFATGLNYQLFHRYSDDNGATWYPSNGQWEDVGGSANSTPSVVSWGANRLDVVVNGYNGHPMQHVAWNGNAWGWDTIPGAPTGSPVAIAHGVGKLDVFATGYGLRTTTMTGTGSPATWSAWTPLAQCSNAGTVAAVSRDGANIDLVMTSYAKNGDAAVWHNGTESVFPLESFEPPIAGVKDTCY